jgi:hypothetical protein
VIAFEAQKLSVKYVELKSVTTALGGSITVISGKKAGKDVYKKVPVPLAVARTFMKRYAIRQYLKPVRTAMAVYDGRVVALERRPLGNVVEAQTPDAVWTADMENAIKNFLKPLVANGTNWYIDGTYVYTMPLFETFAQSKPVSSDGRFHEITVSAVKLADLSTNHHDVVTDRACLMYEAANGERMISPPIWTSLGIIGTTQFNRNNAESNVDVEDISSGIGGVIEEQADNEHFNRVDEYCCVNLAFVLKAARELVDIFGFDSIEPFNLPALMLQMKTVNLPNISSSVKQTYDSGIPFTHMCAWLLGLLRRAETLESHLVIRQLMKYLTTKGVYRKNAFDTSKVFKSGHNIETIPLKSIDEAATTTANFSSLAEFARAQAALQEQADRHEFIIPSALPAAG